MRIQRHTTGSVRYDKRRKTWNYLWYDGATRRSKRIGTKQEFRSKASVWIAVERMQIRTSQQQQEIGTTMREVIKRYEAERMPTRPSTAYVYRSFLKNHISPKWGDTFIGDVQPRPVELWLCALKLSPKSKTHVRSLMHSLVEFAMWAGLLEMNRNPISLVRNKGATHKVRKARSLTVDQFRALLKEMHEPFAMMALLCVCLGLRVSEALALRWEDVDWLQSRLSIRRGIVQQHVDECKTEGSAKTFVLAEDLIARLKAWKQATRFGEASDWVFASPMQLGKLPWSYTGTRMEIARAAKAAGIGHVSTHCFRHTFRSWLNVTGAPIATQQKLMRHSTITMTMDTYGTVFDEEVNSASLKVAQLAFHGDRAQDGAQSL